MPLPAIAGQPRRVNAEDRADLARAHRSPQLVKAGAACPGRRDSEIVIDHVDVLPAQCARPIDQAVLAALAFTIVLHLTRRGLPDVHTGSPCQVISGDLVHRRPPRGAFSPRPASTAPGRGVTALARPREVGRRAGVAGRRRVVAGVSVGTAASGSSSSALCREERPATATRCNSRSTGIGRRTAPTTSAYAASGCVIQPGTASGVPSARSTT